MSHHISMASMLPIFAEELRAILSLEGGGERRLPLVCARKTESKAVEWTRGCTKDQLFPGARSQQGAMAGLWLYLGCFEEAHEAAQELHTVEGSYWHAIVHRVEPDDWNSGYWFRRVGEHAIFGALAEEAARIGAPLPTAGWNPFSFVEMCARARAEGGTLAEMAQGIQLLEWQLLFEYCVRPKA